MITALMSSMPMATIYSGSPFVGGDYKSQDVLIAMAWCHLKVKQASVESEIFLSGGILALDLVRHLSLEKLGKVLWSSFGHFSHSVVSQITGSLC